MKLSINDIFNNSSIIVFCRKFPLKFTISAEVFLEENGISVLTLSKLLLEQPVKTCLLLAFAGLPREDFRDKMSFDAFQKRLTESEGQAICERVNVLCEAYFKHLLGEISNNQGKTQKQTATADSNRGVKKNFFQSLCKLLLTPVGLFRK